jgi:pimeloyl-ACP methyl ester carboxylesterase
MVKYPCRRCYVARWLPFLLMATLASAQTTRIVPWNDGDFTDASISTNAYHPEPIIFVHGIVSSRVKWEGVIYSNHWFEAYHYISNLVAAAKESNFPTNFPAIQGYTESELPSDFPAKEKNQWRDIEKPYLHTFNYGRHAKFGPGTNPAPVSVVQVSRQSHDPVEWNSWQPPTSDYLQNRTTLNDRIEAIRTAYKMPNQPRPNVILVGHSLGGLIICDYLMTKNQNLGSDPYVPVRRAVTIDSLLWGSPIANILANWDHISFGAGGPNFYLEFLKEVFVVYGVTSDPGLTVWIQNHGGSTKYFTVDLQDAIANGNIPPLSTGTNTLFNNSPFQHKLHTTPMPTTTEFISSGAREPGIPLLIKLALGKGALYRDVEVALKGDQVVPLNSMAGYNANGTPVFTNLSPVDIRGYTNGNPNWISTHGPAPDQIGIYPHLLDGVQYKTGSHPDGAGNWSGFQKQYTNSPVQTSSGKTFVHTDEPGIVDLKLLYNRSGGNPLLIPALNTWTTNSTGPQKSLTNATDFVGHQITASSGNNLRYVGATGAKNRTANPVCQSGTNYWVAAGNEYLPASLSLKITNNLAPVALVTNVSGLVGAIKMVTNCLAQLDGGGVPQYQNGYFESPSAIPVTASTNNFVAAQGYNVANLLTPQAERGFDAPVDSATLVAILKKINEAEALSTRVKS